MLEHKKQHIVPEAPFDARIVLRANSSHINVWKPQRKSLWPLGLDMHGKTAPQE
jgi:hypothetical protein